MELDLKESVKKLFLRTLLGLLVLLQGITLIWMQCCCGDSGFAPCACGAESAAQASPAPGFYITSSDGCSCCITVIEAQQPVPIPKAYALDRVLPRLPLSPPQAAPPIQPKTDVLYTGLAAPPLEVPGHTLDQPFLCVFRC